MKRFFIIAICVSFLLPSYLSADPAKEAEALTAVDAWLSLVDAGKYAESWDAAGHYFQQAVAKDNWESMANALRHPLGAVISRKVATAEYSASLPGAPDAEYVVVQYETTFDNKATATETITPMLEKDGIWRVSGYYIR